MKSGTSKQSDNILGKWIFYSKLIPDVQAVNTNTAELEAIWKLNLSLTLNWRLRRAITLVFAWRYKIQNSKYYGVQEYWRFTPKGKDLWKMKLFASHKHDLPCHSWILKWLAEEDIMNVWKCWYRVIVCLLSRQRSLCKNATGNLPFLWQKETIFIYFTVIIFEVYERKQNWSPKTAL